ncbi:MAG: hypothetical protein KC503_44400 [Myxococcales bacterium]|nr:hypothetical protein [Myxococcales bacterium]
MREQLKLLEQLQRIDVVLQQAEASLEELPKKLQSMKDDVAGIERMLDGERQQLRDAEAYKSNIESEIREEQELLTRTKAKLASVRNSKEYLAVQREFDANRKTTSDREDEVKKLDEAIAQFQESIKVHEEEVAKLREHVEQEEAVTARKVDELTAEATQMRGEREKIAESVEKAILRRYDRLIRQRGKAVVPAINGVCSGCNMRLPPQLYNIMQRVETIEQCPNCQRIVYYPEETTPDEPAAE